MVPTPADPPPTDGYIYELCKRESQIRLLFLLSVGGFGLMILWLTIAFQVPSLDAGTGSIVVATMNLVIAGTLAGVSGFLMRRCEKRKARRRDAYRQTTTDGMADDGE